MSSDRHVLVVQRVLPHYRVPFFLKLEEKMRDVGIQLTLAYGVELKGEVPKTHDIDRSWAVRVRSRYSSNASARSVYFQHIFSLLAQTDLVITEHALRSLTLYLLYAGRRIRGFKVALWGHGANFQHPRNSVVARFLEQKTLSASDWWFAYTARGAEILTAKGFPPTRITVVNNTIETEELSRTLSALSEADLAAARTEMGLEPGPVGLFLGGMYPLKRLPFLIEAAKLVRQRVPGFSLLLVGSGPCQSVAEEAARRLSWVKYMGDLVGPARVGALAVADVILMPGLVGLVAIDSLFSEAPLVTTAVPYHSPEIDYITNRENGLVVEDTDSPGTYANAVCSLLEDADQISKLRFGCRRQQQYLSLDEMVDRFVAGIEGALEPQRCAS